LLKTHTIWEVTTRNQLGEIEILTFKWKKDIEKTLEENNLQEVKRELKEVTEKYVIGKISE
jgi:hypothetical protein